MSIGLAAGRTYWSGISVCPCEVLLVLAREHLFVFYCGINVGDRDEYKGITKILHNDRSAANSKLVHHHSINNFNRYFYFTICGMPWQLSIFVSHFLLRIKTKLKLHTWNYFLNHFNATDPCTFHMICPCARWSQSPRPPIFDIL